MKVLHFERSTGRIEGEMVNLMNKMGFCTFTDGYEATNHVAPKSEYSKEQFEYECTADQFYKYGETKEGFVRWYPKGKGEDNEFEGGCYSFCKESRGSFAVWYNEITGTLPKGTDPTESPSAATAEREV